jgi:hypothetical protein
MHFFKIAENMPTLANHPSLFLRWLMRGMTANLFIADNLEHKELTKAA